VGKEMFHNSTQFVNSPIAAVDDFAFPVILPVVAVSVLPPLATFNFSASLIATNHITRDKLQLGLSA
jgi:hypothetical protein